MKRVALEALGRWSRRAVPVAVAVALLIVGIRSARASDGGDDAGIAGDGASSSSSTPPLACNGALCDTTNGAECAIAGAPGRGGTSPLGAYVLAAFALVLGARRRKAQARSPVSRYRGFLVGAAALSALSVARQAHAETQPAADVAVDVAIASAPPPRRTIALEWNPLPLVTIGKLSANVVFVPTAHHALVISPFYASVSTAPIYVFDETSIATGNASAQLPRQKFQGFGAELGYRYYFGEEGPRGLYVGPSLVLASFTATASDGSQTPFFDVGLAADVGYEVLLLDSVALSLGGGLQYVTPTKSIPDQQYPAQLYANRLLRPRVLLSLGWVF